MGDFRYNLIRYIPDLQRMEPINVGLVLQGEGNVHVRFDPNAGRLGAVRNLDEYRAVKDVLMREVNGAQVPLFQPPRESPAFVESLATFSSNHVDVSVPLDYFDGEGRSFDELFMHLFARLVLRPGDSADDVEVRPTGAYRQEEESRKLIERGLRKYAPVLSGMWNAYRQYANGVAIVIDKVEDSRQLGHTANQIDKLAVVASGMKRFMAAHPRSSYYLIADELKRPFPNQEQGDFDLMRYALDARMKIIVDAGGKILRSPDEVHGLARDLDVQLPKP